MQRRKYECSRLRYLQHRQWTFRLQHLLLRRESLGKLHPGVGPHSHKLPESSTINTGRSVKNFLPELLQV
jgi:hypothetical protein